MRAEGNATTRGNPRTRVLGCALALFLLGLPMAAPGQDEDDGERVRVPQAANVHQGPMTARIVLVVVPEGTVLPVVGRRGEWYEVELSSELRETGSVLRWYENEETGWVHESTVELVEDE